MTTHVYLTVDLGFGDAGKGGVVDYLARQTGAHTVVRYNGGAQAAHRVVEGRTGREHVFSQFGSAALAGSATYLSRFMVLDPPAMLAEAAHLADLGTPDALERTTIEAGARVITPFARAINRLRELARGTERHGSCGMGVGETVADALRYGARVLYAADLREPPVALAKLRFLRQLALAKLEELRPSLPDSPQVATEIALLHDEELIGWLLDCYAALRGRARVVGADHLATLLAHPGVLIFEGAQGALLDEWRGFHPYTTWSTTTLTNATSLLVEAGYRGGQTRIGITRAYTTRHGAGPLPSEDATLTAALPDARNGVGPWQHGFRVGWLDFVLLRYARAIVGPLDALALTCLDRVAGLPELRVCTAYDCGGRRVEHVTPAWTADARGGLSDSDALTYADGITRTLLECRPLLEPVVHRDDLFTLLEHELGVPVQIASYGPSAEEKCRIGNTVFRIPNPARPVV